MRSESSGAGDAANEAEDVFAAWLARVEAGEELAFEELLVEHPAHADALRRFHEDWKLFGPVLRDVVPGLIASGQGLVVPSISGAPEDGEPESAGELFARLGLGLPDAERYRFRAVLGRGGGGVVLKVWDKKLNRPLALKVVLGRGEALPSGDTPRVDRRTLARFVDEARITSQLNHPGIVPVHEISADETGRAFFTMKLVKGENLGAVFERVRKGEPDWPQVRALDVLLRACEAMAYAHDKGVVHRDLKPANVMVGPYGEVQVMDWGLARVIGEKDPRDLRLVPRAPATVVDSLRRSERDATPDSPLLTIDGTALGTPCYMPPEQAKGQLELIGPRSDVYAVGAMLYHLLAGEMPYVPRDAHVPPEVIVTNVMHGSPRPLTELAPNAPAELVAICDKAMSREIDARYPSMLALATDLRAFLDGRVVAAYETGAWAEAKKWVKRNRALAASLAAVLLALVAGLTASWVLKARADANAHRADENTYYAAVIGAQAARKANEPASVRRLLDSAPRDLRNWEWHYLDAVVERSLVKLQGHTGPVFSASFSPDGSRVVTASWDESARVWDAASGKELARLEGHTSPVGGASISPDGKRVLTASDDMTARVWDAVSGKELALLEGHTEPVRSASFSSDGTRVVTASGDMTARVWDAARGKELARLEGHTGCVNTAAFSPDGTRVLTVSADTTARIWDAVSGKELARLEGHTGYVNSASFSPDGSRILTASEDTTARVWDAVSGKELARLEGHTAAVHFASFSPDGSRVVTNSSDGTVSVWDAVSGEELSRFEEHTGPMYSGSFSPDGTRVMTTSDYSTRVWTVASGVEVARLEYGYGEAFSPDGSRIVTLSKDNIARIWDATSGVDVVRLEGHKYKLRFASFSPDGSRVVTADIGDKTVHVWDAGSGKELARLEGQTDVVLDAFFSPDGTRLVTTAGDNTSRVCDAASGEELARLDGRGNSALFSPDGTRVVTASGDMTARVWNVASGEELMRLEGHTDWVLSASFSPDGLRVVTASNDKTARVWDASSGKELARLEGHESGVGRASFSPDGSRVLTYASKDQTARVWDAASGAEIARLEGHMFGVMDASFSPNGSCVVTTGEEEKTARVWDAATGKELARLEGHTADVNSVSFSPDGSRVVTASTDKTVRVWEAATGKELARLEDDMGYVLAASFSPDGSRIVAASSDGIARVWDAVPYRERYAQRRVLEGAKPAGERAFERALTEGGGLSAAAQVLRADAGLDPLVRRAALDALTRRAQGARDWLAELRRASPLEADQEAAIRADTEHAADVRDFALECAGTRGESEDELKDFAWSIVAPTDRLSEVPLALRCAQRAVDLAPYGWGRFVDTLGVAQYRVGAFESSLATLESSDRLRRAANEPRGTVDVAFLAMARWQLGQQDEARAELAELERLAADDDSEQTRAFLTEARALIEGY